MKLKLTNGKELDVSFWSFAKCHILVNLALGGLVYLGLMILGLLLVIAGVV